MEGRQVTPAVVVQALVEVDQGDRVIRLVVVNEIHPRRGEPADVLGATPWALAGELVETLPGRASEGIQPVGMVDDLLRRLAECLQEAAPAAGQQGLCPLGR